MHRSYFSGPDTDIDTWALVSADTDTSQSDPGIVLTISIPQREDRIMFCQLQAFLTL